MNQENCIFLLFRLLCAYESHWDHLDFASFVMHSVGILFSTHLIKEAFAYSLYDAVDKLVTSSKEEEKAKKITFLLFNNMRIRKSIGFSLHSLNNNSIIITSSLPFGYGILVCLSKRLFLFFFSLLLFVVLATRQ